jgi:hypothetical protein
MMRLANITISLLALSISTASAIDCLKAPDRTPGPSWRYRIIDGAQCWYRGETVLPKADLSWPKPAVEPGAIDESPAMLLTPVLVRTIAYRQAEHQITQGRHVIASVVVVIGFCIVIAGMFWSMRRRRKGALGQIDISSIILIPIRRMRASSVTKASCASS